MQASTSQALTGRKLRPQQAVCARPAGRLVVTATVDLQGGPRIIRGKCFVTRDVSSGLLAGGRSAGRTSAPCLPTCGWVRRRAGLP